METRGGHGTAVALSWNDLILHPQQIPTLIPSQTQLENTNGHTYKQRRKTNHRAE